MSTTRPRAPINHHADPLDLDDGTLVRTESAPPGTIGIKGGETKNGGLTELGRNRADGSTGTPPARDLRPFG